MGVGGWVGIIFGVAAIFLGWARLRVPSRRVLNLSSVLLVLAAAGAVAAMGYEFQITWKLVPALLFVAVVALVGIWERPVQVGAAVMAATPQPKAAEENPSITYAISGGTHIHIYEPSPPTPRFPRGSHEPDHRPAFVRFRTQGMVLIDSHGIDSITDNGTGDFTFTFSENIKIHQLTCVPMPPTPFTFKAVTDFRSIRVVFEGDEPEIVGFRFDD